jgi:DNA-binding NtrC family response regulator/tetratricopeptide (TPR) repeat protein
MRLDKLQDDYLANPAVHHLVSLVERKDFTVAVEFITAGLGTDGDVAWTECGTACRCAAESYHAMHQYASALKYGRMAQNRFQASGDSLELAETFVILGKALRDSGEFREAIKSFTDAESIFRRYERPEGQSRALNHLAGLYQRMGDYKNALTYLMDAIEIARVLGDKHKLAFMMGNLGRIHLYLGNYASAKAQLKANVELSTELGDTVEIGRALMSTGYLHIQEGDFAKAEETLDEAWEHLSKTGDSRDSVMYFTYLGEMHYRTGRSQDALIILTKAVALAETLAKHSTLTARALRHLAEAQYRLNNHRAALRSIAQALPVFEAAGVLAEQSALLKLKGLIAESGGQLADSRITLKRAIDLAESSGVRCERIDALLAAGRSQAFTERERMVFLLRAEESCSGAGLEVRALEVQRLIVADNQSDRRALDAVRTASATTEASYVTTSQPILRFLEQMPKIGKTDIPVLLTGETGVGKDHLARHYHSVVRPSGPFVAINCASVPETLLESELFGYHKGAFTGAHGNKPGLFVAANGGVLFLDEIGDLPVMLQAKLLGVLERRCLTPLGSTEEVRLDVKLLAATNRNLEDMVEAGSFRRDLYYRLSGLTFHVPSLRERKEDIPLLLRLFLGRCGLIGETEALPPELVQNFIAYDWPGNVRELYNKVKRLEVMVELVSDGNLVELARSFFPSTSQAIPASLFERVERFEYQLISEALLAAGGNKSEAARLLGIHEATVRSKLRKFGVGVESSVIH